MYGEKNKDESLYHAALIYSGKAKAGNDYDYLKEKLQEYGSFEEIYKNFNYGLISLEESLRSIKGIDRIAGILNSLNFDFKCLTVNDTDFPETLKKSEVTPVIYARGNLEHAFGKTIAVVGTRDICPNKDRQAYEESFDLMKRLVKKGYTIVSGLAEGCDTIAHTRAIALKGKTIAVLGTPLNQSYPASNKDLQELIAKEHLLISQYPVGIKTFESYFACRNLTTVSLATEGIVVIKAIDNSGTMHAVRACYNQGKPIYVLSNNFNGKNKWIEAYKGRIKRV